MVYDTSQRHQRYSLYHTPKLHNSNIGPVAPKPNKQVQYIFLQQKYKHGFNIYKII